MTTALDMKYSFINQIDKAIAERDSEALRACASVLAADDDLEAAGRLVEVAKQIERDDMAFDEARDNEL